MFEHRQKLVPGFTSTYNLNWLAYYEATNNAYSAMSREKQIKSWRRTKKTALVETINLNCREPAVQALQAHHSALQPTGCAFQVQGQVISPRIYLEPFSDSSNQAGASRQMPLGLPSGPRTLPPPP